MDVARRVLKLSSNVSDGSPKVLKLSCEVSECKPLPGAPHPRAAGLKVAAGWRRAPRRHRVVVLIRAAALRLPQAVDQGQVPHRQITVDTCQLSSLTGAWHDKVRETT